ncbi:MAG: HDOD domain-containing protein [Dechloromonas sp.]|nr:HDOD domain-containing protein [Dechloromonas sp.]
MDKQQAFASMAEDIRKGELAFPTHVRVSMRLRDALADPDCHVETATRLVQAEPVLAARIVAMANSVAYNPYGREISDLRTAVTRLGFSTVRTLAMALVTRQMAGNALPAASQETARQLWEHTAHVAALARVIARRVTRVDPEAALFAGIIHEVSGFFLLSQAADYPGLVDGDFSLWMTEGEQQLGRPLLAALGIPHNIREAVECYWEGFLGMPPVGLGNTLLLAEELAPVPSPLHQTGESIVASGMSPEINMLIGESMLSEILEESREEVESLREALQFK